MKKVIFKDKYPIYTAQILKSETSCKSVDDIVGFLKDKVENHPFAVFITVFDHMAHTKSLKQGVVAEGMLEAKNVIFCFGKEIPVARILAIRPRSIGICEFADRFEIDMLEAPKEKLQSELSDWINELRK